ncbi:metal-dependent transcriptional regulator [Deinococcus radiophilus]|uniref:Manganese transport regulator n=1 Tax=Deinococcus radiophilus TaxID=32062 RepID=A0A431VS49_9DEIO|nr:metal-dependent transcriptional regulator [Deinococcus radiophilus]RTR26026.1 metal-dependent transcriptional regulator [Deinococcus radiophilus]UFA51869.1 metal-dependent transcriptional regulator [Deinococcus radiophilus]
MSEPAAFSPIVENYLKHLYLLGQEGGVSTTALANALNVSPASATSMLRKLADQGLLMHTPYRGAQLTVEGERAALEVLRHHRLLELFLHRALGMPIDEVHEEAERLEHAMSERLETYIAAWLGDPTHDPHGDPIPTLSGELPQRPERRLTSLRVGDSAVVARVPDTHADQLRALMTLGIQPEAEVQLVEAQAALGTVGLRVRAAGSADFSTPVTLAQSVAAQVSVLGEASLDGPLPPASQGQR